MAMKQIDTGVASFFRMRRLLWRKFKWFKKFPLAKGNKKVIFVSLSMSLLCCIFTLFLYVVLWIKERLNTEQLRLQQLLKKNKKQHLPVAVAEFNWTSLSIILFLLANFTSATAFPMSSLLTTMPPSEILSANLEITPFSGIFPAG